MDEQSIRTTFETFTPTGKEETDYLTLNQLAEEWKKLPQAARREVIPSIFGIFERYPGTTGFGSPGPLVHALEAEGGYEGAMKASLARMPSFYAVCMVNRILNAHRGEAERVELLSVLRRACELPRTPELVRAQAEKYSKRHA